jgi:hypothetical protein
MSEKQKAKYIKMAAADKEKFEIEATKDSKKRTQPEGKIADSK